MSSTNDDSFDLPSAKRQKRRDSLQGQQPVQLPGSKIFSPYRTLGLVTTKIPFTFIRLGKSTYQITTSVGRSLQTYDLQRGLSLVFVSRPQTPDIITATFAWQDRVFAAWGSLRPGSPGGIWVFKRGKKIASLELPPDVTEPIDRLLVFGSWVVGSCGKNISVWKNASYEHYTTLFPQQTKESSIEQVYTGQICNMPTYLNKIFVGRCDGKVDIWNVKSGKLIHSIVPASSSAGAVTALQASPVLSLIAIAYKNGPISVCDVQTGEVVLSLRSNVSRSREITSLTFRTDGLGAGEDGRVSGVMATACVDSGDITMWDLNNGGRVSGVLRQAHKVSNDDTSSGVSHIQFLDGQPVMISSGGDNSLKTWIFDQNPFSSTPRLLHSRSGHSAPVTAVEFLPAASDGSELGGKWLLSASKDRSLWGFSARKDSQNTEISQGAVEHKLKKKTASNATMNLHGLSENGFKASEITCIACSLNRDGGMGTTTTGPIWANPTVTRTDNSSKTGWESIVTGHRGDKYARTWFWGKKKAGRWTLETGDGTEVKSVAMSQCGTFAIIGSAGGSIDMFNLQSGAHRQSFPVRDSRGNGKDRRTSSFRRPDSFLKHSKAVTGLMIDSLNRNVVSCGLDGKVKFWDLVSGSLVDELDWYPMTSINGLRYSRTSELVALGCDDLSIRVVDVETRKVIREFWGCIGQINDFSFSNDGRWIIAASMDSTIRVWDLPTGHLIDVFRVSSTCTSVAMSSTGEFLATAHADGLGISLWSNRSLFVPISTQNVDDRKISSVGIPASTVEYASGVIEAAFSEENVEDEVDGPLPTIDQLSENMVTLSVVPKSKWQTFLHLNLVKERNRPKEPPKAPSKAPFFLPSHYSDSSTAGTEPTGSPGIAIVERSRITKMQRIGESGITSSKFTNLLQSGHVSNDFNPFIEYLKSLPPAKADLQIRSLEPQRQANGSELSDFVIALSSRLHQRRDFELVNAWMAVFLRVHADSVAACSVLDGDDNDDPLKNALLAWSQAQRREAQRLAELVGYCRGVVGFLRSAR